MVACELLKRKEVEMQVSNKIYRTYLSDGVACINNFFLLQQLYQSTSQPCLLIILCVVAFGN